MALESNFSPNRLWNTNSRNERESPAIAKSSKRRATWLSQRRTQLMVYPAGKVLLCRRMEASRANDNWEAASRAKLPRNMKNTMVDESLRLFPMLRNMSGSSESGKVLTPTEFTG